jgi:hypothetical protein
MAEFNNIGLKPKTYAWMAEFRKELERQLERKVTFSEAASITIGRASKGQSGETLALEVAREMKERVAS